MKQGQNEYEQKQQEMQQINFQPNQAPVAYQGNNPQMMVNHQMMMGNPQMMDSQQMMMNPNQQMMMNQQMMVNQQMMMGNPQMMMGNPQMMMGMVPPNPNFFGGMQCFYVNDPFSELASAKKASIKQRFEPWEVISGCETANQYYVFVEDKEGRQKYLFKAKEESSWCCRNFCSGSSREFTLHINTINNQGGKEVKEEFARFERPFKCTCCCLARPELIGKLIQKGVKDQNGKAMLGESIGKVVEKFTCCNPQIQVKNINNKVDWTITCNCCQCGYYCRNSIYGKCSDVDFEVYNGTGPLKGKPPGRIKKKFKGLKSAIGDADFFDLFFPEVASPQERFMLVVAVIMLDYMYYEDKDSQQVHHHGYHYGGFH